ncbi:hypothetical protein Lser_V15G14164 [Lactuca serriola]
MTVYLRRFAKGSCQDAEIRVKELEKQVQFLIAAFMMIPPVLVLVQITLSQGLFLTMEGRIFWDP